MKASFSTPCIQYTNYTYIVFTISVLFFLPNRRFVYFFFSSKKYFTKTFEFLSFIGKVLFYVKSDISKYWYIHGRLLLSPAHADIKIPDIYLPMLPSSTDQLLLQELCSLEM